MLRRLAFVPLAALGVATAFLVSGAGSAVTSAELVSAGAGGVEASTASGGASVSGDGRYVAFHSSATNLPGVDGNGFGLDVFVRDRAAGVTERLTSGNGSSSIASISDDGRWVAFQSTATDIAAPDPNASSDVFLYDRDTDTVTRLAPASNGASSDPAVSGDGNFVAFTSTATNITVGGSDSAPDVYRWTRADGTIEKMSVDSDESLGAGGGSFEPAISDDGNLVAFATDAVNLIPFPGDINNETDIYLRNVSAGTTEPVSVDNTGALPPSSPFTFGASLPAISGDGRYVAFDSWSSGLTGSTNGLNVYLRDRTLGTTIRVSTGNGNSGGTGPVAISDNPHVLFQSGSQLVAGGDTAFRPNIYRYAIGPGTLERVSVTPACVNGTSGSSSLGARNVAVSDDGSTAAYANEFTNMVPTATIFPHIVAVELDSTPCTPTGDSDTSTPVPSTSGTTSTGTTSNGTTSSGTTTTTPTTTSTTTAATTTSSTGIPAQDGAPRLLLDVTSSSPGDPAGFRHGESLDIHATITNRGDGPAHNVVLKFETVFYVLDKDDDSGQEKALTQSGCISLTLGSGRHPSGDCVVAAVLGPGETRRVTLTPTPGRNTAAVLVAMKAISAETETGVEQVTLKFGPAKQERCEATQTCPTSDGDDNRECVDTRCFFGGGSDRGVCAGSETVCSGGRDEDQMICLREATCSGGADDDFDICRSGATCTEDASDDTMNCAGAETLCNAGNGENTIFCKVGATCIDGGGNSDVECAGASVSLGRGDHEVEGRNCKWTIGAGDNVLDGSGTNRVTLKGPGTFVRTGGGTVVVDANNGEKNVIDCNGGGTTVRTDPEDDPRDCETVIGADVLPVVYGGKTAWLWHIHNLGPADATQVRVNGRFSIERASVLSSRVRARSGKCTLEETDTAAGATVVVECLIPIIQAYHFVRIDVSVDPTSDWREIVQEVVVKADAPMDHKPENNSARKREQSARPGGR